MREADPKHKCHDCGTIFIVHVVDNRARGSDHNEDIPWLCTPCDQKRSTKIEAVFDAAA